MRRVTKSQVRDQLGIPPQTEEVIRLKLSAIETAFYRKQFVAAMSALDKLLRKWRADSGDVAVMEDAGSASSSASASTSAGVPAVRTPLSRDEAKKVLDSLLRVRQACCHPQVAEPDTRRSDAILPRTMGQVLEDMIGTAKNDCERFQREIVFCLHARAGLTILDGDVPGAAALYRSVLSLAAKHAHLFRLDRLQRLHAVKNLADCLEMQPAAPGGGEAPLEDDSPAVAVASSSSSEPVVSGSSSVSTRALHVDQLRAEVARLENEIISAAALRVRASFGKLLPALVSLDDSAAISNADGESKGEDAGNASAGPSTTAIAKEPGSGCALKRREMSVLVDILEDNETLFDVLSGWLIACLNWLSEPAQDELFDDCLTFVRSRTVPPSGASNSNASSTANMYLHVDSPGGLRSIALDNLRELAVARNGCVSLVPYPRRSPPCNCGRVCLCVFVFE